MYREYKHDLQDILKLCQLLFLLLYLISRNMFYLLSPIHNFEFFYIPMLSITVFFFYYYELINNLCWVCLMIHVYMLKPGKTQFSDVK